MVCAGGSGDDLAFVQNEASHYAITYAQDGPVEVQIYKKQLLESYVVDLSQQQLSLIPEKQRDKRMSDEEMMDFFVLVGHRKETYKGEYAPEALEVIDDIGNHENPDFLIKKKAEYERTQEFNSLTIIRIRVPAKSITDALYPKQNTIHGSVVR